MSWALDFLGTPKTHILNVKISALGRKYSELFYRNINFHDLKYGYAYRIIFLGAHFENFVIPIVYWNM